MILENKLIDDELIDNLLKDYQKLRNKMKTEDKINNKKDHLHKIFDTTLLVFRPGVLPRLFC